MSTKPIFELTSNHAVCGMHTDRHGNQVLYIKESRRGAPDLFSEFCAVGRGLVLLTQYEAGSEEVVGAELIDNIENIRLIPVMVGS